MPQDCQVVLVPWMWFMWSGLIVPLAIITVQKGKRGILLLGFSASQILIGGWWRSMDHSSAVEMTRTCQARRQCSFHQEKLLVYQYNVAVLWWRRERSNGERYVLDLQQWSFALANIHLPVLESKQPNTRRFLFGKFGECPKGCWMYFWIFKEEVEGAESWIQTALANKYLLHAVSFITSCSTWWCVITWERDTDIQLITTDCGWMGIQLMLIIMRLIGYCRSNLERGGNSWKNHLRVFRKEGPILEDN
jgi:hypothetical protein